MGLMEYADTIVGIVGGALAGFFSSYFFWRKDIKLKRPRLFITTTTATRLGKEEVKLELINKGNSYAENIFIDKNGDRFVWLDKPLPPQEKLTFGPGIGVNETVTLGIKYEDVFGKRYQEVWFVCCSAEGVVDITKME